MQNTKQIINIIWGFLGDIIGISISSLAIVFIPQSRYYSPENLTPFEMSVGISNSLTLLFFLYLYTHELRRELWLVRNLDYSKRYDSLHLKTYKRQYPELFNTLSVINMAYYRIYKIGLVVFIINTILSATLFIAFTYADYKTVTTLFTNSWFCFSKIHSGIGIAQESIKHGIGYSYYNTQNMSFNRIDSSMKRHVSTSKASSPSPDNSLTNSLNEMQLREIINEDEA
jgi:hypothetical protein